MELEHDYQATGTTFGAGAFADVVNGRNHLYGFQFGGAAHLLAPQRPFQIDVLGKAGLYGNAASMSNTYADAGSAYTASATAGRCSFVGELGVTASYRFTSHLVARGGYQLMWLDGVALGPQQIASTDFTTLSASANANGNVFYHGATAGLEVTW